MKPFFTAIAYCCMFGSALFGATTVGAQGMLLIYPTPQWQQRRNVSAGLVLVCCSGFLLAGIGAVTYSVLGDD